MAKETKPVVHSDAQIMGGTPVFVGTRVPFQTLLSNMSLLFTKSMLIIMATLHIYVYTQLSPELGPTEARRRTG
jgi:hypothetical protein